MQEASTIGEVGKFFHHINAALENRQADHQSAIVEIEVTITNQKLSILIDSRSTLSYITPKMMDNCEPSKLRYGKP